MRNTSLQVQVRVIVKFKQHEANVKPLAAFCSQNVSLQTSISIILKDNVTRLMFIKDFILHKILNQNRLNTNTSLRKIWIKKLFWSNLFKKKTRQVRMRNSNAFVHQFHMKSRLIW